VDKEIQNDEIEAWKHCETKYGEGLGDQKCKKERLAAIEMNPYKYQEAKVKV
tara:strand:+ start:299 stop:454 length:156 start_codon:yes stop_codon:yes gene_type:complete